MSDTLSFSPLLDMFLNFFQGLPDNKTPWFVFTLVCHKTKTYQYVFDACLGDNDEFYNYLKFELESFFAGYFKFFFCVDSERICSRRRSKYEKIVNGGLYMRECFHKKILKELYQDLLAIHKFEMSATLEQHRQIFLNCIKNCVHRLFLIKNRHFP